MKRILVIGAGTYQLPAIQRIQALGHEAFCVDYKDCQPGFQYAKGYRIIDVKDKETCLQYARELNVDGVITWGATLTLPTVNFICEQMGLPTLSRSACEISTSKYRIRKQLTEKGANCAGDCFEFCSVDEARARKLKPPFVIKPSDGSGSKGVSIVVNSSDIDSAIEYAFCNARDNHVYVEPYIVGEEYTAEAFVSCGSVYVNTIIKTEFYWEKEFPIYKQTTYLGISSSQKAKIEKEVINAVKALDINFGPVNVDLIMSKKDDKPYIIDVGIRNGQNLIASHIIPYSRGVNELDCCINMAIGREVDASPTTYKFISSRLLIYKPGDITEIKSFNDLIGKDNIVDIILRKKVGDKLAPYKTKSDICGWVLCDGDTPEEASKSADYAWRTLSDYIIIKRRHV